MTDKVLNIHEALIEFHKKFHGATKTGVNPHFKSQHFTLDDVIKASTPVLLECGLYTIHQVKDGALNTAICDAHGGSIVSSIPMAPNTNPQVTGSLMTYFKRYNLCNLLNIAEADDDGNAATADAELQQHLAVQKEKAATPKMPPTQKQLAALQDHIDSGKLGVRQLKYLEHNWNSFTSDDVKDILKRMKESENGK